MARSFLPDNSASPRYDAQRGPGELAEQQIPSGKVQGAARILLSSDSLGDAPAGSRDPPCEWEALADPPDAWCTWP